jgi:RimJ/RimL family protein N-acetyltransferase
MRQEARQVDKWHYKGQWATELIYAVLADEWRVGQAAKRLKPDAAG